MNVEDRLAELEAKLQYMTDRQQVLDCVARNARGCDRHDSELLSSSYHQDGIDEHGAGHIKSRTQVSRMGQCSACRRLAAEHAPHYHAQL